MSFRTDWRFGKKGMACSACGTAFPRETPFHSAIYAEKDSFLRRDLCGTCFAAAPAAPYSHWQTRIPEPEEHRRIFDLGLASEFLRRLAAEEEQEARAPLTHLLALLLVRKRIVRLTEAPARDGKPRARVEFHDGTEPLEIPAPALSEEDVPGLREELGRLLDLGKE